MAKRQGVMLAHPAEPKRIGKLGKDFIVQPKLNGVRAKVEGTPSDFKLVSSSGATKHFLDHIIYQLKKMPYRQWDGELYVHGKSWEWVNSRVSRTKNRHPDIESVEYHIFDFESPGVHQRARGWSLEGAGRIIDTLKLTNLKVVPTYWATPQTWGAHLDTYMEMGYEGIMFRDPNAFYEQKRSPALLKYKPTKTDIYKIKYLQQGIGWCHDRLGAFIVEDKHGNEFGVGTGPCLTAEGRANYWEIRDYLRGRYLLVKHEELKTINDLPKCVVAVKPLTEAELEVYLRDKHEDLQWEGE